MVTKSTARTDSYFLARSQTDLVSRQAYQPVIQSCVTGLRLQCLVQAPGQQQTQRTANQADNTRVLPAARLNRHPGHQRRGDELPKG